MIRAIRCAGAAALLAVVTFAQPTVATAAVTTQTLLASKDTYVNGNQPGYNFSGASDVVVHNFGPKAALVSFDLTPLVGERVYRAELRFRINGLTRAGSIDLQLPTAAWMDTSVTFGTQPAASDTGISIPVSLADVGRVVAVDVTPIVTAWLDGSLAAHGFRLASDNSIKATIDTLESGGAPMELVVTSEDPPGAPGGGTHTLVTIDDTYVNGNQSTINFSSRTGLVVHDYGPKSAYVDFDVTALSGLTVERAMLRFKLNALHRDGRIDIRLPLAAWSGATLDFTSQPAAGGPVLSIPVRVADVGTVVSADVTDIVADWVSGVRPAHGLRLQTGQAIRASIDSLESAGMPMQLEVTAGVGANRPPVLAPVGDRSVAAGDTLVFDVSGSDADGAPPSITASNLPGLATPANFVASGGVGSFSWTPTPGDVGTYPAVTFRAVDSVDASLSDSESITITVLAAGTTTRTLTATDDTFINGSDAARNYGSGARLIVHNFGPKIGLLQFDLSALEGQSVSSAELRFGLIALAAPGNIDLHLPTESWSESAATYDTRPASASALMSLPVSSADVGRQVTVDVTSIVADWADGTRAAHGFWLQTADSIRAEIQSSEVAGLPIELVVVSGPALPAATAPRFDPPGGSYAGGVEVSLSSPTPGADIRYTLDGTMPDDSSSRYVSPIGLTQTTTLTARAYAQGFAPSPAATAEYAIQIDSNGPPELVSIGPRVVDEGSNLAIGLSASDPDADALSFSTIDAPTFVQLTDHRDGTATLVAAPGIGDFGEYSVQIVVTDDGQPPLADRETFPLTVADVNQPPSAISISNATVQEGAARGTLVGVLSATDPDSNDLHSYVLDDSAGGRFELNGEQLRVLDGGLLDRSLATTHDVSVTVTDSGDLSFSRLLTITVNANAAPVIAISSHALNDDVASSGFILSGSVSDDTGVADLVASLEDPLLGTTIDAKSVEVAANGRWSLVVFDGQTSRGERFRITMSATDDVGKTGSVNIDLNAVAADHFPRHIANRITFGVTPSLEREIRVMGPATFIARQLDPASIDDSTFLSTISALTPATIAELQRYQILHAAYSQRQLLEVMTLFWDNHFNTSVHSHHNVQYELDENVAFRANALGRFRTLLGISAQSPAMLMYLNGVSNVAADPNENYARELMELHTLKVDGGYTQADVDEVARAFTGWTVVDGLFSFNAANHDFDEKLVLGQTIPAGGGMSDGVQVLDILAAHPSTAKFICEKLVTLFVDDMPPPALVSDCAAKFSATLAAPDQIKQVLDLILSSTDFADPRRYRTKVKTPFEFTVSAVRQFDSGSSLTELAEAIDRIGMPLFENHIPTGYSETGNDWISTNLILERMRFANQVGFDVSAAYLDPLAFFPARGYETSDGIVAYLFELSFGEPVTQLEWDTAYAILTDSGAAPFYLGAENADLKLRRLIGTILSYPAFNYQ